MKYIYVGKIVNTHGIKGEVKIISKFKFKDRVFRRGNDIYIGDDKVREVINSYRPHKKFDMITIKGIDNINDVLKYKSLSVYVDPISLNLSRKEYLDEDLINLSVFINDNFVGYIKRIEDYDKYKLLVVNYNEIEYLFPYNSDIIESINFEDGVIRVKYSMEEFSELFNICKKE